MPGYRRASRHQAAAMITSNPPSDDEREHPPADHRRAVRESSGSVAAEAFVIDALRTPIGRYRGALSDVRPDDLAAHVIAAVVERTGVDPARIDDVYMGAANQAGEDNRNVARMAALLAGLPVESPGVTVNRLCASGLEAVNQAARAVRVGRGRPLSRRRRRVDDPRAAGWCRSPNAAFPRGNADAVRHDARLAHDQPEHGRAATRPSRWARRPRTSPSATSVTREDQDALRAASHQRAVAAARGRPLRRGDRRRSTCPQRRATA